MGTLIVNQQYKLSPLAQGGTKTFIQQGDNYYAVHTFTGSGVLSVLSPGNFEYLVVAGGGGGGFGGGGGGGVLMGEKLFGSGDVSVVIGNGGLRPPTPSSPPFNGGNSFLGSLIAIGGGAGANGQDPNNGQTGPNTGNGNNGGSGGGGGHNNDTNTNTQGGLGTLGQGFNGGGGYAATNYYPTAAGGGGGAGGAGQSRTIEGLETTGGAGGVGLLSDIAGVATWYGAGGGGAYGGLAGSPGAGVGGSNAFNLAGLTTANTGGGGGGANCNQFVRSSSGASGIVVVRYRIS